MKLAIPSTPQAAYIQAQAGQQPELVPQNHDPSFFDFVFELTPEVEKAQQAWLQNPEAQNLIESFRRLTREVSKRKGRRMYR